MNILFTFRRHGNQNRVYYGCMLHSSAPPSLCKCTCAFLSYVKMTSENEMSSDSWNRWDEIHFHSDKEEAMMKQLYTDLKYGK